MLRFSRLRYLLKVSTLFLGLSFLLLLSGTTNGLINSAVQKLVAGLLSVVSIGWVIFGQKTATPAASALLVWVGIYTITVIFSIDSRRSLTQMELMGISIFLFALVSDLVGRGWPREVFVKALLMVGAIVMLLGWLEVWTWYSRWLAAAQGQWLPNILYRPSSANIVAMFMNLMLMLAAARLLVARSRVGQLVLVAIALSAFGLLFLTSSRGGWLGTLAGSVVIVATASRLYQERLRNVWLWVRTQTVVLASLTVGIVMVILAGGILLYQQTIHPSHGPVLMARSEYWPPAWQAFLSDPLTGTGPFTYAGAFLGANSVPPKALYIHSHGTPFNLLAEMGLLGFVGLVFLVGTIGSLLWRKLWAAKGEELGVMCGAVAALGAVGIHSLFDCFHTEPIGLWGLVVTLGAALGGTNNVKPRLGRLQNLWVLAVAGALWFEIWVNTPLNEGADLANAGQWKAATASFELAVQRDPGSVIAYQQLGLSTSMLAKQEDIDNLDGSIAALEEVVQREPAWSINHANLGALYLTSGDTEKAIASFEEAMRRAPGCGLCALNLGVALEQQGDQGSAIASYQQALDLGQPADAYFWRSSTLREEAQQVWLTSQAQEDVLDVEQDRAALTADPSVAEAYLLLAEEEISQSRFIEAQLLLEKAALGFSSGPGVEMRRDWLRAEIMASQGDMEGATQLGEQVLARYHMYGLNGPGTLGYLSYAPLMFRRSAMALEIVPQLVRIPMTDAWGQRAERLAGWYEQNGNLAQAEQVRAELRRDIPDYSFNGESD